MPTLQRTLLSQAKGKGKGKDKGGKGKSGGKLVKSNLTIADRKAKLTELKSKSRCLRCGVVGHWAGDAECRFKGNAKGASAKPSTTPASSGGPSKGQAPPKPQAYMAVEDSDGDDEIVILSNAGSPSHGYMAVKASPTKPGKRPRGHVPTDASFGSIRYNARQPSAEER